MLDALQVKSTPTGVQIGIYGTEQALKAENHLKTTARSQKTGVPKRQFLPGKGETFRAGILKELRAVARELKEDE